MARRMIVLAVALVAFFAAPAAAQYTPTTGTTVPGSTVPGSTVPGGGVGGTGVQPPPAPGATGGVGTAGTGVLPRTGADDSTRPIALVGAGLLAAGGIVLLSVRRRQGAT